MGKSNRIRANRSNTSLAASVKAPKKKGMPSCIGVSEKTIRRRLSASNDFVVENSTVKRAGTK